MNARVYLIVNDGGTGVVVMEDASMSLTTLSAARAFVSFIILHGYATVYANFKCMIP